MIARFDPFVTPELPPPGRLRHRQRVELLVEILGAYVPLLARVRSNDVRAMLAAARSPRRQPISVPLGSEHETAVRLGRIVTRVLEVLPTDNRCLIRSLVTLRMLEHRSIEARLVIGVRNEEGFLAHAWVEYGDRPILPAGGYRRLVVL